MRLHIRIWRFLLHWQLCDIDVDSLDLTTIVLLRLRVQWPKRSVNWPNVFERSLLWDKERESLIFHKRDGAHGKKYSLQGPIHVSEY